MTPSKTTAGNQFVQSRTPHKKTSGSSIQWLVFCIAIVVTVCGIVFWRMKTAPVSIQSSESAPSVEPQPSDVQSSTEHRLGDVQSLIADLVPIPKRNFLIGKTEVTQAQWEAVMGDNPSCHKDPNCPVEFISWDDCQEFLKRVNELPEVKESGFVFRLPTNDEWEYTCLAGSKGAYGKLADGTEITEDSIGDVAWVEDNSEKKTHPVAQKKPNAFGLYDMHGNVWEWCQNEFGEVSQWAPGREHHRLYHGGSWLSQNWVCMTSVRQWCASDMQVDFIGFRLCAEKR